MIKEDILKIEYEPIFDGYAVKITYQNHDIIKRGNFNDCGIKSINNIQYEKKYILCSWYRDRER